MTDKAPRLPFLATDMRRSLVAVGVGIVVGMPIAVGAMFTSPDYSTWQRQLLSACVLLTVFLTVYTLLTALAFSRLSAVELRRVIRVTNRRRNENLERLLAAGPTSWVLTAVGAALVGIAATLLDRDFSHNPWVLALCGVLAVVAWTAMQAGGAVALMRLDVEKRALRFPGPEGDPTFADYQYASQQILSTMATSDVSVMTTSARRTVRTLSTSAMVFNTVVIALLVSGLLSLVG